MNRGGLLNAIFGSTAMIFVAVVLGAPIGILAGTHLAEYGKKGAVAQEAKPAAVAVKCDYSRSIPTPEWVTQAQSGAAQREAG